MKGLFQCMTCKVAPDTAAPPAQRWPEAGVEAKMEPEVPAGHVPVEVGEADGEAAERFSVPAELLGRPAIAELLRRSAQEYGYGRRGPLRVLCSAAAFRGLLGALAGDGDGDVRGGGGGPLGFAYYCVVV